MGTLIAFEGIDSSGKSTQSKLLVDYLKNKEKDVVYFDFPRYDSTYGKFVAKYLKGEFGPIYTVSPYLLALLFALDRAEVAGSINDYLKNNFTVVCNRYTPSSIAHQAAKLNNSEDRIRFIDWIKDLENVQHSIPQESIVIFLDMPDNVSSNLQKQRETPAYLDGQKDIQEEDRTYQQRVQKLYKQMAASQKNWITISCVDANNQLYTPDAICIEVLKSIGL